MSILARLLRIRLLRLDATAVIVPADMAARLSAAPGVQRRPSTRSAGALPYEPSADGHGRLAEAVRTIDEGAAILAQARRTAAARRPNRNGGRRR